MTTNLVPAEGGRLDRFINDEWRFPDLFRGFGKFEPEIRVEEIVDGDVLTVRAEAPGIDPEKDVDISMANGKLFLKVERRESHETKEDGSTRSEFRYGSFRRTLLLPEGTTPTDVKATYKDGILEVKVPMPAATAVTTKVPVSRS